MHEEYSLSVHEPVYEEDYINDSLDVQDLSDNINSNESPSNLYIQKPSRFNIKSKSNSSIKSKPELIKVSKVSKCSKSITNDFHPINSSSKSIPKILIKECRICLEDESEGRIIKPCKCTGSMQYVHEHCLSEWIKRKINFKTRAKVQCEVCEEPFEYKISKRISLSCEAFKQNYEKYRSNYICFMIVMSILILVWLSLAIVTIIGFSASTENWIRKSIMQAEQTRIVFICVILVYLLIITFVSLLFLAEYGVKSEFIIKNVKSFGKKSKKIVPKLYFIAT